MTGKPDWKDVPEWAMYRSTDRNGSVYYFASKPVPEKDDKQWEVDNRYEFCEKREECFDWENSLEERPND